MFISDAFAQTAGSLPAQGPMGSTLIQLGLIFVIFYVLLIRPQQKKFKQHEAMLNAIQKGDEIITGGGIYGKVVAAEPYDLTFEIADGVKIKVARATVRELLSEEVELPAAAKAAKKEAKGKAANSNKKAKK